MNTLHPLTTLLAQTERERDQAMVAHQAAQAAHLGATAQHEQLLSYRRDYEKRWGAQFAQEGKIELVRCYQGFMERLTQAVDQQTRAMQTTADRVQHAVATLQAVEVRCASVRRLIERRIAEQRAAIERSAQKQLDEQAARAAWGQRNVRGLHGM
jgi:flagellar protein FliJ